MSEAADRIAKQRLFLGRGVRRVCAIYDSTSSRGLHLNQLLVSRKLPMRSASSPLE